MSDESDSILEGVMGEGLRLRSGRRAVRRMAADNGIPLSQFVAMIRKFGLPGNDPSTQEAWLKNVQAEPGAPKAVDWNALIQAIIANLPTLLALCGA